MKKIMAFSIAVLMLALVLASCGKSDVPSGMKRVESDRPHGMSMFQTALPPQAMLPAEQSA